MNAVETVKAATLKVGDKISETGTPDGDFYPVVKVNAKSIVIDARYEGDTEALLVNLRITPNHIVAAIRG